MRIIFATNNTHKIREIRSMIPPGIGLVSLADINFTHDIAETGDTLEENALIKARTIYNICQLPTFADDSGLEIACLNGEPGVHSARYAGETKNMEDNIDKVLLQMDKETNRKARFRTVIAFIYNGEEFLFEGIITGTIIRERRGHSGFGYDPVFIPDGRTITFAEMSPDEKNLISHRSDALRKLVEFLSAHPEIQY
jgi:XTP/dITP diphosphohydrolase